MLSTAGQLRDAFTNPRWADSYYPVNGDDQSGTPRVGPLIGRYPGDVYDGDRDQTGEGHPWALCTSGFAELYYRLATIIQTHIDAGNPREQTVLADPLAAQFFSQVGVDASTAIADVPALLCAAADQMLQALVLHSAWLDLSEQFDKRSGVEKSVSNLTWSYASFCSAVRARP